MSDEYSGTPSADSYYERLGTDRTASDDDIDTASKVAKRAIHPDNNSSEQATAEREFDRVTDAGDVLTDSDSRAAYDTFIKDQGPETGTELYEQWDSEGRPGSPAEWLAEPRATNTATTTTDSTTTTTADSTTTTADATGTGEPASDQSGWTQPGESGEQRGDRRGWSEDEWNARARTRDGRRGAGEPEGADASATRPGSDTDDDNRQTTVRTGADAAEQAGGETTIPTGDAVAGEEAAADATTGTTTTASSSRSPRSVLNKDPEEMYSEYVLESEPEWRADSPDGDMGQSDRGASTAEGRRVTASAAPAPLARLLAGVVGGPLAPLLTVAAPKSRRLRGVAVAALIGVAVVLGPVGEALVLLPLVVFPRVGPWLFGTLAAAAAVVPGIMSLAFPAIGWLALAIVSGGYFLLIRGSQLDPYASA